MPLSELPDEVEQQADDRPIQGECHPRVHARLPTRYARTL